jgi:hypothetical protein
MTSLFPPCGPDCLKQRELDQLKSAMDSRPTDQAASIAYYTALYGQDWLAGEKNKLAKSSVEPVLVQYRTRYDNLKQQLRDQSQFSDIATAVRADGGITFLQKDYEEEKSKADVLDRLWILNNSAPRYTDVEPFGILLYLLIAFLVIIVVAMAYIKYRKYASPPSFLGGNRLR